MLPAKYSMPSIDRHHRRNDSRLVDVSGKIPDTFAPANCSGLGRSEPCESADLSRDMAIRLAKAFGGTPEGWMRLQFQFDAAHRGRAVENNKSKNIGGELGSRVRRNESFVTGFPGPSTGGERGIRTLDRILSYTPLAGARLRPLGHLSVVSRHVIIATSILCHRPDRAVAGAGRFIYDGLRRDHSAISPLILVT